MFIRARLWIFPMRLKGLQAQVPDHLTAVSYYYYYYLHIIIDFGTFYEHWKCFESAFG